jgi:hypothetical protein
MVDVVAAAADRQAAADQSRFVAARQRVPPGRLAVAADLELQPGLVTRPFVARYDPDPICKDLALYAIAAEDAHLLDDDRPLAVDLPLFVLVSLRSVTCCRLLRLVSRQEPQPARRGRADGLGWRG